MNINSEEEEEDEYGGLTPGLYQFLYLPKVLEASQLELWRYFDKTKEEEDKKEAEVFAVLLPDESWDVSSEMSDFDFDINLGDYGLVTADSSSVVTVGPVGEVKELAKKSSLHQASLDDWRLTVVSYKRKS